MVVIVPRKVVQVPTQLILEGYNGRKEGKGREGKGREGKGREGRK
jgi:hypothetical protein